MFVYTISKHDLYKIDKEPTLEITDRSSENGNVNYEKVFARILMELSVKSEMKIKGEKI